MAASDRNSPAITYMVLASPVTTRMLGSGYAASATLFSASGCNRMNSCATPDRPALASFRPTAGRSRA